jgi:hypothetical protein
MMAKSKPAVPISLKTIFFQMYRFIKKKGWKTDIVTLNKYTLSDEEFNKEFKYAELIIKGIFSDSSNLFL